MKKPDPLVTVLMSIYNGEKYLAEAIKSVLNQTLTDFELLIVDDCSTDKSCDIINSFNDIRIRLGKNEKNIGQTKSLNIGINASKGKFIARIDQDDLYRKDKLLRQVQVVLKYNYDIVGSWANGINENNNILYKIHHPINDYDTKQSMIIRPPFTHSSLLIKKESLIEVDNYPENIHVAMDYGLLIKLAIHGCTFSNIPEYLTSIRYHGGSSSMKNKYLLAYETLTLQKKTIDIVSNQNLSTFKGVQFYRLIQLIKYIPSNFLQVMRLIKKEIKLSYMYYFIKMILVSIIKNEKKMYATKIIKIKQV